MYSTNDGPGLVLSDAVIAKLHLHAAEIVLNEVCKADE